MQNPSERPLWWGFDDLKLPKRSRNRSNPRSGLLWCPVAVLARDDPTDLGANDQGVWQWAWSPVVVALPETAHPLPRSVRSALDFVSSSKRISQPSPAR